MTTNPTNQRLATAVHQVDGLLEKARKPVQSAVTALQYLWADLIQNHAYTDLNLDTAAIIERQTQADAIAVQFSALFQAMQNQLITLYSLYASELLQQGADEQAIQEAKSFLVPEAKGQPS